MAAVAVIRASYRSGFQCVCPMHASSPVSVRLHVRDRCNCVITLQPFALLLQLRSRLQYVDGPQLVCWSVVALYSLWKWLVSVGHADTACAGGPSVRIACNPSRPPLHLLVATGEVPFRDNACIPLLIGLFVAK